MRPLSLLPLVLAVSACSGDPDILGFYETTHHTLNTAGCSEGSDRDDVPYFRVVEEEFFGVDYVSVIACTSDQESDCGGVGLATFFSKRGGGWEGEVYSSSGGVGGSGCTLGYFLDRAVREGDMLRIEITQYGETDETLVGDACDPDEAERRKDSMPCERFEVIEGVRADAM